MLAGIEATAKGAQARLAAIQGVSRCRPNAACLQQVKARALAVQPLAAAPVLGGHAVPAQLKAAAA
jgi:hypothetical protein